MFSVLDAHRVYTDHTGDFREKPDQVLDFEGTFLS